MNGHNTTTNIYGTNSKVCVVLGGQWGDEGKGKLVDILAQEADLCCRFNGGANAGHSLVIDGKKYAFHLLPCGIVNKSCLNLIGNGVVLHIPTMMKELEKIDYDPRAMERVFLSNRASLLFDAHQLVDGLLEGGKGGQSHWNYQGIGPCYSTKTIRNGLRVGDLLHMESFETKLQDLFEWLNRRYGIESNLGEELERYKKFAEILKPQIVDSVTMLDSMRKDGKRILIEGANAAMLDIDFGTYPYVTSSSTTIGGACIGLGLAPRHINCVIGVVKAYTTRVGAGPFPTELFDENGEHLRTVGHEFGTTTGRPRRCGWLDLPILHYSTLLNGFDSINITKLDVLSGLKELKVCLSYRDGDTGEKLSPGQFPDQLESLAKVEVDYVTMPGLGDRDISNVRSFAELPIEAQNYLNLIVNEVGVPISWVGVGADRNAMFKM